MKIQEILQSGFFNVAQIARTIGVSHPSVLHQKLNKKKGNKLTEQNQSDIKKLLEKLIKENEVFNLGELSQILINISECDLDMETAITKINQYQEKYADIGLVEFYHKAVLGK